MTAPRFGTGRPAWFATVFLAAVFGGVFWMILAVTTSLLEKRSASSPSAAVWLALGMAVIGGAVHLLPVRLAKTIGAAVTIGALLGLPVLGYFAVYGWATR